MSHNAENPQHQSSSLLIFGRSDVVNRLETLSEIGGRRKSCLVGDLADIMLFLFQQDCRLFNRKLRRKSTGLVPVKSLIFR